MKPGNSENEDDGLAGLFGTLKDYLPDDYDGLAIYGQENDLMQNGLPRCIDCTHKKTSLSMLKMADEEVPFDIYRCSGCRKIYVITQGYSCPTCRT